MTEAAIGAAITAVFFAGVMWVWAKQGRRDINGLGRKMNKTHLLMVANEADETKRKELARALLEP